MTTAETLQIPNEVDDDNDFWPHPIHTNHEANRNGTIRHSKYKNIVGSLHKNGYYQTSICHNFEKKLL